MSDIIHLLPDSVANQIAAGEVIQRPASVLKELVENSIDAGATLVKVLIKDAGTTLIQVTDNGKGMSETDARMAFERHATSKIKEAVDLFSLRTMGFRGEALASIAAVAQVELRTRRAVDELGTSIEIAGTRVFKKESVQCDSGTSLMVKNLFFNVPARRRFLKSNNVEKSHILSEFYRIVLVNPEVEFYLYDGADELLYLPVSNLKVRIENVFGRHNKKKWEQQLLPIDTSTNLIQIKGFVGKPEFSQKSAIQFLFVNGRFMRHSYFHKAILLAYNQMIQASESPNYFIYFEVDPQSIDINIHPTKTEIKFEHEQAIWSILNASIKEVLGKFNVTPSLDFDQEGSFQPPPPTRLENILPPETSFNPNYNPFASKAYVRPTMNWEQLYTGFEKKVDHEKKIEPSTISLQSKINSANTTDASSFPTLETNELRKIMFQLKQKYIVSLMQSGLLLIDQQRAHIRILYDRYLLTIQENTKSYSQQLLYPEEFHLSLDNVLYFDQLTSELTRVGFDLEKVSPSSYLLKGIPSFISSKVVQNVLAEMLETYKSSEENPSSSLYQTMAFTFAKATAIDYGTELSLVEMQKVVEQLFTCENHRYTPDGKKIMVEWDEAELEAKFR
jgi:DNA mismatch repair protein MutL